MARRMKAATMPSRRVVVAPLPPSSAPPGQRLLSIDALRGFTMFWIVGGREVLLAAVACVSSSAATSLEVHLTHPDWQGFATWDLIMPVFLFLVGTSMPFALAKRFEHDGVQYGPTLWRIARRVALLWICGMIAHGALLKFNLPSLQLYSDTLQAIAVGYLVTSLALMFLPVSGQIILFAILTIGYACLLQFVPFGGWPAGTLERTANLPRYIDQLVLGSFRRTHDFTWVLTSLGFSATVLLGASAGNLLRGWLPAKRKLALLITTGLALLALGWLWSYSLPLNRHLWTSSVILWGGGWGFLLLALFYGVIDIAGVSRWAFFFVVIGANALLAYVIDQIYDVKLADALVRHLAIQLPAHVGDLLRYGGEVGLLWLILWYLYRNRTFLRA
jgi:predicted acyltransferase